MNLDGLLGHVFEESVFTWTQETSVLYALAIGIGDSPRSIERFGWASSDPACFPTLGTLAADAQTIRGLATEGGAIPGEAVLYAGHQIEVLSDVPPAGRVVTKARITGVEQGSSGVFVTRNSESTDATSGTPIWRNRVVSYVRGGTLTTPTDPKPEPDVGPCIAVSQKLEVVGRWATRPDQALLYGLTGDTNPIHGSTVAAQQAGLSRPILHGLCGFGGAVRVLLDGLTDGDERNFMSAGVEFRAPVYPGDALTVLGFSAGSGGRRDFEVWSNGTRRMRGWIQVTL